MIGSAGPSPPAAVPAGWVRWAGLAVFTGLVVIGLVPIRPNAPAAALAAVVAVGAGATLAWRPRPLLVYAVVATGGVAVLGDHLASNVGWFAVCLVASWCALAGTRREALAFWAGALVERFRSAGADVTFTVDGDTGRLHATTGLAVYRILQEALTNAIKHAAGCPVSVRLTVAADTVRLAVDTAAAPGTGTGLGLVSMRERAESLGGSFDAGPGGRGWLVEATLPLTASPRREATT